MRYKLLITNCCLWYATSVHTEYCIFCSVCSTMLYFGAFNLSKLKYDELILHLKEFK